MHIKNVVLMQASAAIVYRIGCTSRIGAALSKALGLRPPKT